MYCWRAGVYTMLKLQPNLQVCILATGKIDYTDTARKLCSKIDAVSAA